MKKKVQKKLFEHFAKGYIGLFILLLTAISGYAQNVGISPGGASAPNPTAGLDVNFTTKGLLIPRVALQSTTSSLPIASHIAGMLVYNTATAGDVVPGFYYNDGTQWVSGFPKANATGDIQYWDGSAWITIPAGQVGDYLQISNTGIPAWVAGPNPTLYTAMVSSITSSTAVSGGTIQNDGGSTVTAYGVCWSINQNPTLADSFTNDGSGIGNFVSNLTGLASLTTYYIRAYATTASGTYYGNELNFTTP